MTWAVEDRVNGAHTAQAFKKSYAKSRDRVGDLI
jgi:hypothetical protein